MDDCAHRGVLLMLAIAARVVRYTRPMHRIRRWEQTAMDLPTWKQTGTAIANALDPLSKLAQIIAIVMAGIWAYRMHLLTGEEDIDPEVWVSTQTVAYSKDARLLVVHIREKNGGKVPVTVEPAALTLTVKKVPDSLAPGYVKMDSQPALFEEKHLLGRDNGLYLST